MRKAIITGLVMFAAIGLVWAQQGSSAQSAGRATQPSASQIEHGRYIVHHVAMCIQCHTPRDERGELITRRLLQGAPIPVRSPWPNQEWCYETPPIAGLPGWSDADAVRFLMTGLDPRGYTARPPMPPFRMSREDAEAVVAYLRSLR